MTPEEAYYSARRQGSSDGTRKIACQSSYWAYHYAREVDRGPHDDTRAGACQKPFNAYRYAYHVDRGPRDDTRSAACQVPSTAFYYALEIDLYLHPEAVQAIPSIRLADAREQFEFD